MSEEYQIIETAGKKIPIIPHISGSVAEPKFVLTAIEALNIIQTHREQVAKAYELIEKGEARKVIVVGGSFQIVVEESGTFRRRRSFSATGNLSGLEIER